MQSSVETGSDCGSIVKGVTIIKPIIYGNIAKYFGKKREEDGHTHEWTVYVRPYHNEDMSTYVKKVHFKLHESYLNQNRVLTKPPYEVTETGWGEFEIIIKIYFHDPNERPVTVYHILKLFQTVPGTTTPIVGSDYKQPLISEFYDELIFQDPSSMMHQLLVSPRQLTLEDYTHHTDFEAEKVKTVKNLQNAKEKVFEEIKVIKEKINLAKETLTKFKSVIETVQNDGSLDEGGIS